ncbi:MAG: hypothetical protein GC137_09025 [Alphaproteobacteria bacterium]|nr:hypothetical protein [Alphaproteobacteria bacterium]
MTEARESYETIDTNPLDSVEDVLSGYNWVYSRTNDEELVVEVSGKSCAYRILFLWQPDFNALQLCCQYGLNVHARNMDFAALTLMDINSSLWMGHFDITRQTRTPCFRYTAMLKSQDKEKRHDYIEDLVDISLIQCERYETLFTMLGTEDHVDSQILSLAMMETAGES